MALRGILMRRRRIRKRTTAQRHLSFSSYLLGNHHPVRDDRTAVEYKEGGTVVYGKRERPHLIFDPSSGEPTHLCTGVCLNSNWTLCNDNPFPGYFDYTFTSVQVR